MSLSQPLSVYFHNFWNGFIEKTDTMDCSFFVKLLEKTYSRPIHISTTPDNADVLVESIFGHMSYLEYKKWKATILFTGETHYCGVRNVDKYDCVLGFEETGANFVKCPLYIVFLVSNPVIMKQLTVDTNATTDLPSRNQMIPPNAASVILSNVHGGERLAFLDHLEKKLPVNYGGKYKNNLGHVVSGHCNSPEMTDFYRGGKFAITMENGDRPHYITEKIVNGFRSGVIPVYWGTAKISEYFNPRRFLRLKSASQEDMDELANVMVTMTNQEYFDIISEPILVRPINDVCEEILASVKKILTSSS
jgi:hypothetical protein